MIDIANEEAGNYLLKQQEYLRDQIKDVVFILRDCIDDDIFDDNTLILITPTGFQIVNKLETMQLYEDPKQ